jgi:hypothetical protein
MPAKWKSSPRFKPDIVLKRIREMRTRNPDGKGSSFSGWNIHQSLPLLNSMLVFPDAAQDLDRANLIWRAVAYDPQDLTKESFLKELNKQISAALAIREETFHVLTSISITNKTQLGTLTVSGIKLKYCGTTFPRKFIKTRSERIQASNIPASDSPHSYTKVVATVKAKKPSLAISAALRAIDLQRALWCLFCNTEMEIIGRSWVPINSVRLGAIHTVHTQTGEIAGENVWFEPQHFSADAYTPKDSSKIKRRIQGILARINNCGYGADIVDALLLYVRALDEWNQNTAFIRLWSALERLASPEHGDYDAIVRRCAFLWDDPAFATQTLEHLREYRNGYMHTGTEMPEAKIYCFQLQQHFRPLVFFHIGNSTRFHHLKDANKFLDLPTDVTALKKLHQSVVRASHFRKSS